MDDSGASYSLLGFVSDRAAFPPTTTNNYDATNSATRKSANAIQTSTPPNAVAVYSSSASPASSHAQDTGSNQQSPSPQSESQVAAQPLNPAKPQVWQHPGEPRAVLVEQHPRADLLGGAALTMSNNNNNNKLQHSLPAAHAQLASQQQQTHPGNASSQQFRGRSPLAPPRGPFESSFSSQQPTMPDQVGHHHLQQAQQQQQQQQQQAYHQPSVSYEEMYQMPAAMNMMTARTAGGPNASDPRLLDYSQQHMTPAAVPAMRTFMVDSTPGYAAPMDFVSYGEPWEMPDLWSVDSNNPYGNGHALAQQRQSLTHDGLTVFGQRPVSLNSANGQQQQSNYLAHAAYEASRRPPPPRMMHDVMPAQRPWLPTQLSYDPSASSTAMAAPPRTMGNRAVMSQNRYTQVPTRKSSYGSRGDEVEVERKKPRVTHSPMAGENRLKITFVGLGTPGEAPQHFGTKGFIIPDGLSGMHQVYHQRWRFDIRHMKVDGIICVSWSITNLTSGTVTSRTETPREARVRETSGHTICNQLLRQALQSRAVELEQTLPQLREDPTKYANTENLVKALRPKSCILGLLFFGLLHDAVQNRMRELSGGHNQTSLLTRAGDHNDDHVTAGPGEHSESSDSALEEQDVVA